VQEGLLWLYLLYESAWKGFVTHLLRYILHLKEALENSLCINILFLQANCLQMFQSSQKRSLKRGHLGKCKVHVSIRLRGGLIAIARGEGFLLLTSSGADESLFCKLHLISWKALGSYRNRGMKCKGLK